ncbi:MAG TPA: hypothetical protein VFM98_03440 [Ramlibacter sp.]|nr:hypothetical protein [Ramlibacter sp.]HET8744633.1 hypothetical protein [Ramlibacter sp.]
MPDPNEWLDEEVDALLDAAITYAVTLLLALVGAGILIWSMA